MTRSAPRKNVEAIYPLSPLQRGLLFHALYDRESVSYMQQAAYTLRGAVDADALERAWQRAVDRHPVLRTGIFGEQREEPMQVVSKSARVGLERLDWRDAPDDGTPDDDARDSPDRLAAFLERDRRRGFDLKRPPLLRLHLIRAGEDLHHFVLSFPHLLLDGWSVALLLREVFAFYRDPGLELPAPPPFSRYISWLRAQDREFAERYWRRHLAGFATPTRISSGTADDTAEGSYRQLRATLAPRRTAALQERARRHRLTLNTVVQGAFAALLERYTGERDVIFGVTVAGRPDDLPDAGSIVGLFMNTLPSRVRTPRRGTVAEWLQELQDGLAESRRFESSSLVDIHGWSELPGRAPLFEVLYSFESYPIDADSLDDDLGFEITDTRTFERTHYPLTLQVLLGEGLSLVATFDATRLEPATALRMLRHLERLLAAMAEELERPFPSLPGLPAAERHALLVEAGDTRAPLPFDGPFSELFAAQVERTPGVTAAVCGGERVSYRQLAERAERVARAVAGAGGGTDRVVALFGHRDVDFLAAILGVLRAGAAYLPLDPRHPPPRLATVLGRSRSSLVLTSAELRPALDAALDHLDAGDRPAVLDLADPPAAGSGEPRPAPPSALAYVIFTSGSTGTPKGVMIEQRGMINHLAAKIADLRLDAGDVVAQTASQCFDISVWQFLAPLLVGGRVHIFPDEVAHAPDLLLDQVDATGVTILETVPSLLRLLLEPLEGGREPGPGLTALRWLIPTGEALPPELCERWNRHFPNTPMLNAYGPTECSDDVTHHPIRTAPPAGTAVVPIGRPVVNTRLYLCDRELRPVPLGIPGELLVAGRGVGRGYLREPAKTAAAFVPDPWTPGPGGRLYRTGDRVRRGPEGALEFLGRLDSQIKIRGFRIELGEVRSALLRHPAITEAVVVRGRDTGADELWAYWVSGEAAGEIPGETELRRDLAATLPDYMVPARVVRLERLPLSPNGKIDFAALPAPATAATAQRQPSSEVEKQIAAIWAEVLGRERIGARDNFFDLGGHSLNATRAMARLGAAYGMKLSVRMLFLRPVLEELAASLEKARSALESGESLDDRIRELRERIERMKRQQAEARV